MIKQLIAIFIYWRLLLFIPLLVAQLVIPERKGYEYTLFRFFVQSDNPLNHLLISPYANFDASYYLLIANAGYTVNAGFFPLFPLIISLLSFPIKSFWPALVSEYAIATVLIHLLTFGSLWLFYKVVKLDYDSNTALWCVVGLLLFPTAFFFATLYSESLFLFLTLLSFYFARKGKWWLAGFSGMLLTATRIVGVAILPALFLELFLQHRFARSDLARTKSKLWQPILAILLTPFGLIGYTFYNWYKWDNPFFFISAQGNFQNERSVDTIVLLPQTLFRYWNILTTLSAKQFEFWIAALELGTVVFAIFMLFVTWKKRVRFSYLVFAIIAFLIPASTGTFSGMPRYALVLFPIFIAIALIKNQPMRLSYFLMAFLLQLLLFALFAKGYFIA